MANIAFFQNRLGRTDGVSLEVDKWRVILEGMGHTVYYCSGNDDVLGNYVIPELYALHPVTWKILRNGTVKFEDYASEAELERDIYEHADCIEKKLLAFIEKQRIDVLVPNNLCSGGYQPAAGIAFHRVIRKTGLPTIIHSHDFYHEDSGEVCATCQTVESIYERYFPTKLPNVQHVVINRISQADLKRRKNLDAMVVPNVFDFDQDPWTEDEYNRDFRRAFGMSENDLLFLQATRILDRKGIEMAIDTIAGIQDPGRRKELNGVTTAVGGTVGPESRIVLLCAGIVENIGISGSYWDYLKQKADGLGVDLRHVGDRVRHSRATDHAGAKVYSLWDSYVQADFVTYPSYWEGWGNQFVEAVFAKLPVLVYEYPVWTSDLREHGFQVVSLGSDLAGRDANGLVRVDRQTVDRCADEIVSVLRDSGRKQKMVEHNYAVASSSFSMRNLQEHIKELIAGTGL
ncbi:MAG: glycosyltransferase, group 1 family protein [Spirochaetaceae bacterium]|nr:MAG: glycosyltransferase, group 1 family protein [Spirochaetaceae bacterium]